MTRRAPLWVLLVTLAVLGLAESAATAPPPAPPDPTCSPGPSDCFAWHTSNVTVTWSAPPAGVTVSGCASVTISSDTGGAPVSCTWSNAEGSRTTTVNVRRDATEPSATASADRGPDANGWYNHALSIAFSGDDATSGIASCTTASYSGPDTGHTSVPGSCTDHAGNTHSTGFELKYDATPPSVEGKPNRQPDSNGWYNHAVTIAFVGTDPVSTVDSCSEPVLYKGPDALKTTLSGTCRDKAANTSLPTSFELAYDTKPPKLGKVGAEIGKRGVVLRWTASKDTHSVTVVRRPGMRARKPSTVYTGRARRFIDRRLKSGVKYRYTVTAYDEAGNAAVKAVLVQPRGLVTRPAVAKPALTKPANGARVAGPPRLTWAAVPKATYYNLQLYRGSRKILTVWPSGPAFHLQKSWTYRGVTYALTPGRYRWYVWPGFGPRSAYRYGKLLGTRDFVVTG
jgi:hypothetical protein